MVVKYNNAFLYPDTDYLQSIILFYMAIDDMDTTLFSPIFPLAEMAVLCHITSPMKPAFSGWHTLIFR